MADYFDKQDFAAYKAPITYQDMNELAESVEYVRTHTILESVTSDPASPVVGQLWLRTDLA